MRITDLLLPEAVQLHAGPGDKSAAIDLLVDLHHKAGNISDKEAYPVMQNPLGYAAALLIGSVAGMFMLGLLKKKKV